MSESEQDLDDERQDPGELAEAKAGGFRDQTEGHQTEADPVIPSISPEAIAESARRDVASVAALSEEIRRMENPDRDVIKSAESQADRELSPKVVQMFESSSVVSREIGGGKVLMKLLRKTCFNICFEDKNQEKSLRHGVSDCEDSFTCRYLLLIRKYTI